MRVTRAFSSSLQCWHARAGRCWPGLRSAHTYPSEMHSSPFSLSSALSCPLSLFLFYPYRVRVFVSVFQSIPTHLPVCLFGFYPLLKLFRLVSWHCLFCWCSRMLTRWPFTQPPDLVVVVVIVELRSAQIWHLYCFSTQSFYLAHNNCYFVLHIYLYIYLHHFLYEYCQEKL